MRFQAGLRWCPWPAEGASWEQTSRALPASNGSPSSFITIGSSLPPATRSQHVLARAWAEPVQMLASLSLPGLSEAAGGRASGQLSAGDGAFASAPKRLQRLGLAGPSM